MNSAEQIREKLFLLEQQLNEKLPGITTALRDIHTKLKKDPEVVTLLSEEDIGILIRGLKKQVATELVTTSLKKAPKQVKKVSLDDLGI